MLGELFFFPVLLFIFIAKNEKIEWVPVERGALVEEIFESGQVKQGEEIHLGFEMSGIVETIYVQTGERVEKDTLLAELSNKDLQFQLEKARQEKRLAETQLKKLLRGAREEEIQLYQAKVSFAQVLVANSKKTIESSRESLILQIKDVYLKANDAVYHYSDQFFLNPRGNNPRFHLSLTDGVTTRYFPLTDTKLYREINSKRKEVESVLAQWQTLLEGLNENSDLDFYVEETEKNLDIVQSFLDKMAEAVNSLSNDIFQYESLLTTYKNSIGIARSNVSLAKSSLVSAKSSFDTAQGEYEKAKSSLEEAQAQLSLIKAEPETEDIEILQIKQRQADAEVKRLETLITKTKIKAPTTGIITKVNKREGEVFNLGKDAFLFLPDQPLQVEVNIYEGEIVFISLGQETEIEFVAIPDKSFSGRVISIDPVGRPIDGVVYYRVVLEIEDPPPEIKPGMTADIKIKIIKENNVLVIPKRAVKEENNQTFVFVFEKNKIKKKNVVLGDKDERGYIEVISGLKEEKRVVLNYQNQ